MLKKTFHVLLVNTNQAKAPVAPIALQMLGSYLHNNGINVRCLDFGLEQEETAFSNQIKEFLWSHPQVDLIGFSIRNIDSTDYLAQRLWVPDIVKLINKICTYLPNIKTVLGGAGFSMYPQELMRQTNADFGIVGEGEIALLALIRAIQHKTDTKKIPGLIQKIGTEFNYHPQKSPPLNTLQKKQTPTDETFNLIDQKQYYDTTGAITIQTQRGCNRKCIYCTYPGIEGKRIRHFSPQHIVDEIEYYTNKKFNTFRIVDSVFNLTRHHVTQICLEIIRRKLKIHWNATLSPKGLDSELACLMKQSGANLIELGVDSCSKEMLKNYSKSFTKSDIATATTALHHAEIDFIMYLIIAGPGESQSTLQETLDFVDDIKPLVALFKKGMRVYPNTPLHELLIRSKTLQPQTDLLTPYFYLSPMWNQQLDSLIKEYCETRGFAFIVNLNQLDNDTRLRSLRKDTLNYWRALRALKEVKINSVG